MKVIITCGNEEYTITGDGMFKAGEKIRGVQIGDLERYVAKSSKPWSVTGTWPADCIRRDIEKLKL